tara:strand:+ start:99 stop:314 length:216 start_codon:yes stop_codon:yes gene_type:complete
MKTNRAMDMYIKFMQMEQPQENPVKNKRGLLTPMKVQKEKTEGQEPVQIALRHFQKFVNARKNLNNVKTTT